MEIGRCLESAGVVAGDSRDDDGRWRFLPVKFEEMLEEGRKDWIGAYSTYPDPRVN